MSRAATFLALAASLFMCASNALGDSPPAHLATWGGLGNAPGQFDHPFGVDVDNLGNVYIADQHNYRVQKFTPDGTFQLQWSTGFESFPTGLRIAPSGEVYVVMNHTHIIVRYSVT